jgi:hypothetical protein
LTSQLSLAILQQIVNSKRLAVNFKPFGDDLMPQRFQVEVVETGVRAICELLEKDAPRTCKALWKIIKQGYTANAVHARWSGPEVVAYIPQKARQNVDPRKIGIENATTYPARGDVCWMYFPAGKYRLMKEEAWDLAFIYGDEARFYIPCGMVTMNVWAKIIDGLDEFSGECGQVYQGGRKTLRLSALKE